MPLRQCAEEVAAAVARFTGIDELHDRQTMLLLRRRRELLYVSFGQGDVNRGDNPSNPSCGLPCVAVLKRIALDRANDHSHNRANGR